MKQSALLVFFAAVVLTSGCSHLKKNQNPKPKESSTIAADTDENFRLRFLEKRSAELVAQGVSAAAAQAQASDEFRARYGYTSAAKK